MGEPSAVWRLSPPALGVFSIWGVWVLSRLAALLSERTVPDGRKIPFLLLDVPAARMRMVCQFPAHRGDFPFCQSCAVYIGKKKQKVF